MIKSHLYAIQFTRYSVVSLGLAELLYSTMLSSVCQVLFSNSFEFVLFLVKLHRFARYFVGRSLERSDILPRPLPFVKHEFYFFHLFLYGSTADYCLLLYIFVRFIPFPLDFHFLLRFSLIVSFFSDFLTFTLDRFRFPC